MTETLEDLLNKIEAIFDCGAATVNECAKAVGRRPQRITEYVAMRKYEPPGSTALALRAWAAKISTRIAIGPKKMQAAYRLSYQVVKQKRSPVAGKRA